MLLVQSLLTIKVSLHLWETAGQKRFGNVLSSFILVYDITNHDSFVGIRRYADVVKVSLIWLLLLHGNNYYTQLLEVVYKPGFV